MKWKLKALAAAVAIAVSAPASATIATSTSGNGELFLTVWDSVSQTSYTRDLGLTVNTFLENDSTPAQLAAVNAPGYSQTFTADSTFSAWLSSVSANLAGLVWNVGAMDGSGANRYLSTSSSIPTLTNSAVTVLNDSADVYLTNVNTLGSHPGTTAVNGSNTASAANDGQAYADAGSWGANWGNKAVGWTSGALIGASNFFWSIAANGSGSLTTAFLTQFGNENGMSTWNLATDGTLTYNTASPAAVPVPAAVWLLGSGLFGLVGIARRRRLQLA